MTGTPVAGNAWVRCYHPGSGTAKLVCFPHAGGAASYFFPMSDALRPQATVLSVQYPGRQDRRTEPLVDDLHRLADLAYAALYDVIDENTVFFGHSMGATVAFEVALRMQEERGTEPAGVVVSGRRAPSRSRDEHVHRLSDPQLVAEVKSLSGTAGTLLDDEEVLRLVLPVLRNDYRAIETYRARPLRTLTCPVTAFVGDADPKVSIDEARDWGRHTTGPFALEVFPGGHFYLADRAADVAARVARTIRGLASPVTGRPTR
jgi:surfactin synthase thioesterase subunit